MAELSFNISDLFERTFGYKTRAFDPDFSKPDGTVNTNRNEYGAQGSPYYTIGSLGLEYYMPVTISYPEALPPLTGRQTTQDASETGKLKKWDLPFPVVSVASRKTIIETPLTERRGTVKELINIRNYEITIKGFIVGEGNNFPESEVTILRNIYEQNEPLAIQCPLTDIFLLRPDRNGSDQVVIKELKFPAVTGIKNVAPYELHLVSDEPFNLISIS
jgi:Domain of unknown function (DUF6046)